MMLLVVAAVVRAELGDRPKAADRAVVSVAPRQDDAPEKLVRASVEDGVREDREEGQRVRLEPPQAALVEASGKRLQRQEKRLALSKRSGPSGNVDAAVDETGAAATEAGASPKSPAAPQEAEAGASTTPQVPQVTPLVHSDAAIKPEVTGGDGSVHINGDPLEEREWTFLEWSLFCGLAVVVCALIVLLCQPSGEKAAVRSVVGTLPLTPLCLLIHREFQVVKTTGAVEADAGDKGRPEPPLLSPVAGEPCVYFHVLVELRTPTGWEIVTDFFDSRGFLLTKDGAQVLVEVENDTPAIAEFDATAKFEGDLVQLPQLIQARLQKRPGPKLPAYSMFRVTEWAVREGDELCAVGLVVRRVRKKVTRTALAPGGLSASNADRVAALFSLVKVGRWQAVGNHVLLTRA